MLFLLSVSLSAQNRDLKISVKNQKGKPVRAVKVETFPSNLKGSTDKNGLCILNGISDGDSLIVIYPGADKSAVYSITGISELQFNTSNEGQAGYDPVNDNWITGKPRKVVRKGEFDVEREIKNGATNLEDLLKRIPSLMVTGGNISLRNTVRTNEFSDTTPLIVVDDLVIRGGLQEANRSVNILMIESIRVEKDGTLWGRDGVNGVILIKMKK
jgi:hypothetical protein